MAWQITGCTEHAEFEAYATPVSYEIISLRSVKKTGVEIESQGAPVKFNKICVIGLGYIGLPTASTFATAGLQVTGVDVNPNIRPLRTNRL